jgi:chromate reductase, NAD(P)H dehydrogenase (quinone)
VTYRIAVLVGSLRKEAFSRKLANALVALAPNSLAFETPDIGALPGYNQDLDDNHQPAAEWVTFRSEMQAVQGVLFVTPEYNRSVPGVLKNAIDVGSRPYGQSIWEGKPGAVASISPGALGAFGANHHLRQSLVFLNVPTMQQPEAYIGGAASLFAPDGQIANEKTRDFLRGYMEAFARWVELHIR